MKTHLTILLFVFISAGSLWGAEYTATPGSFHNIQRNAQSGDTILMEQGIYHGEWYESDGHQIWTPVIYPNGKNIVYKKDPNSSGEVILSGLVPPIPPSLGPYMFRPPCQIINNEVNSCQVIGLTIRCGVTPDELPRDPLGFFEDFCDNYGWMGIECWNSSPLIKDCNLIDFPEYPAMFRGCKISINSTNGRLVIQSCRIADINDGGIGIGGNADIQINNCTISGINTAYSGISAYTCSGSIVEINNCNISNFGRGGIDTGSAESTISDCNIMDNNNNNGGFGYGGGITCNGSGALTVRRSNLIRNKGDKGGAIYVSALQPIIEDCNITGNTTTSSGGGIYSESDTVNMRRCMIENNAAYGDGGGIHSYGYLNAEHCILRRNMAATGTGGGIFASYDANLVNCVINKNHAGGNGGGISLNHQQLNSYLYNCTIRDNEANASGGGAYFGDGQTASSGEMPTSKGIQNIIKSIVGSRTLSICATAIYKIQASLVIMSLTMA